VVGVFLAVGVAYLIEFLDDTVKTPDDLQAAGLGVVGAVQRASPSTRNGTPGLFALGQSRSVVAEAYRTLRTNLQYSSLDRPLHSLVVTSAVATEGKTTTAANLAVVIAQAGKRVVLVDGDLRRPSAHRLFGLSNGTGLTTALIEEPAALNGYLQETGVENLRLLSAGPIPPHPQELLGSQRMADLIHKLEQVADIVVLDTPPTLIVADANVLAARADGVLMVVNTGRTRRAAVQQAAESLRQVGANLLGGVLNMVDTGRGRSSYYYSSYYYSHYYSEHTSAPGRGLAAWLSRLRKQSHEPDVEPRTKSPKQASNEAD
jgi:capsular exopolysaccharide synthesis family protein